MASRKQMKGAKKKDKLRPKKNSGKNLKPAPHNEDPQDEQ